MPYQDSRKITLQKLLTVADESTGILMQSDPARRYAHRCYWPPFILMGKRL